jgi:hypothetical protein
MERPDVKGGHGWLDLLLPAASGPVSPILDFKRPRVGGRAMPTPRSPGT